MGDESPAVKNSSNLCGQVFERCRLPRDMRMVSGSVHRRIVGSKVLGGLLGGMTGVYLEGGQWLLYIDKNESLENIGGRICY